MMINILWMSSLVVAGWCGHILYQDFRDDIKASRLRKRQQREDDEVLRIVSGLTEHQPEVDVASEQIRPTWRERLEDWWVTLWLESTPRTGEQVAKEGFTRPSLMTWFYKTEEPQRYTGRHRADKTLKSQGGDDGLPVAEEEVLRRDRSQAGPGLRPQDDGLVYP